MKFVLFTSVAFSLLCLQTTASAATATPSAQARRTTATHANKRVALARHHQHAQFNSELARLVSFRQLMAMTPVKRERYLKAVRHALVRLEKLSPNVASNDVLNYRYFLTELIDQASAEPPATPPLTAAQLAEQRRRAAAAHETSSGEEITAQGPTVHLVPISPPVSVDRSIPQALAVPATVELLPAPSFQMDPPTDSDQTGNGDSASDTHVTRSLQRNTGPRLVPVSPSQPGTSGAGATTPPAPPQTAAPDDQSSSPNAAASTDASPSGAAGAASGVGSADTPPDAANDPNATTPPANPAAAATDPGPTTDAPAHAPTTPPPQACAPPEALDASCDATHIEGARHEFYSTHPPRCLYAGNFSSYRNNIAAAGQCQPVNKFCMNDSVNCQGPSGAEHSRWHCPTGQAICNPLIFELQAGSGSEHPPFCVHRGPDVTQDCATLSDAASDKHAITDEPGVEDAWNAFAGHFNEMCLGTPNTAQFFCKECTVLKQELYRANTENGAIHVTADCRADTVSAPSSHTPRAPAPAAGSSSVTH